MKAKLFLIAAAAIALAVSCQKSEELEPGGNGTYDFGLSVINKDYTEEVVFSKVGATTIKSVENLPAWVTSVTLREEGFNGDPVALVALKGDANLDETRQAKIVINMGSGATVNLELIQWPTLKDDENDVDKSMNTAFEKDWAGTNKIKLVISNESLNGRPQITELEVSLPWDFEHNPLCYLPRGAGGESREVYKMIDNKQDWALVFNLTGINSYPNRNYFGLYNRYSGILRIFYYFTDAMVPQNANDHMWSFAASYDVAEHVATQFALPMEETATSSFKHMAAQPALTSPTTDDYDLLKSNQSVPKVGWWAFDVNMAALRKDAFFTQFSKNSTLDIKLCTYQQANVLLNSVLQGRLNGKIAGKVNLDQLAPVTTAEWGKWVIPLVSTAGTVMSNTFFLKEVVAAKWPGGSSTKEDITIKNEIKLDDNDLLQAPTYRPRTISGAAIGSLVVGALFSIGGKYLENLAKEKVASSNLGDLNATVALDMNAVMTTAGTISGPSTNLVPAASMTKGYLKETLPDGKTPTYLGSGVWNLNYHPVVYVVNDAYWSENHFTSFGYKTSFQYETTDGPVDLYSYDIGGTKGSRPGLRLITFLDPTSVKGVSFNEKLLDEKFSQIRIYLSYGVYPGSDPGYTDTFRKAAGMGYKNTWHLAKVDTTTFSSEKERYIKLFKQPHTADLFRWTDVSGDIRDIAGYRLSSQKIRKDSIRVERRYFGASMYYNNPYATDFDVDDVQFVYDPQIFVPFDDAGHRLYDPIVPDLVVTATIAAYGKDSKDGDDALITSTLRFLPIIKLISYKDIAKIYTDISKASSSMTLPSTVDEAVWVDMKTQIEHIGQINEAVK